jgi:hypothetical protein
MSFFKTAPERSRFGLWRLEARFFRTSNILTHCFGALICTMIVGQGIEMHERAEARAEAQRVERVAQIKRDEREITCLTNVVYHEARGEVNGVRELVGKTVLAIVDDKTLKQPKTVCGLAEVKGMFSSITGVNEPHFAETVWMDLYAHMSDVYYGERTLPRGWGCVRGFRVSDDQLEKLGPKALAQLGFTVEAKGLKYFAAHRVPVDTRGRITFYSPRGGCSNPSATT